MGAVADYRPKPLRREHVEVLELLANGLTYEQIGDQLDVLPGTIREWIGSIHRRLGARNSANAVALAINAGVISGPEAMQIEVAN